MQRVCKATTKQGKRCGTPPLHGKDWCYHHDPALADRRKASRIKGGESRSTSRRAAKIWKALGAEIESPDLPEKLRSLIPAVERGQVTPGQANAIVNLAKGSVQIANDLHHEERIAAIERALQIQRGEIHT